MSALPKGQEPTMEDILASIRRIIADDHSVEAAKPADEPKSTPPVTPPFASNDVLDLAVEATPAVDEPQSQDDIDLLFNEATSPAEPAPQPVAPVPPPAPVAVVVPPAVPPQPAVAPAAVAPDLLSQAASASVASAFASLSSTMLTGNARTLEDLMKDMLRPMLKTWLDDNLPSIVEKLVRAEIERVARGGR
jgi:uncharacterized protein